VATRPPGRFDRLRSEAIPSVALVCHRTLRFSSIAFFFKKKLQQINVTTA
jgi:hypothetical protein